MTNDGSMACGGVPECGQHAGKGQEGGLLANQWVPISCCAAQTRVYVKLTVVGTQDLSMETYEQCCRGMQVCASVCLCSSSEQYEFNQFLPTADLLQNPPKRRPRFRPDNNRRRSETELSRFFFWRGHATLNRCCLRQGRFGTDESTHRRHKHTAVHGHVTASANSSTCHHSAVL